MPPSTYAQRNNVSLSEPLCRPFHREERGCRETSRRHVNKPCSCVLQAVWLCTGALELSVVYCNFNCCYICWSRVLHSCMCTLYTHNTNALSVYTSACTYVCTFPFSASLHRLKTKRILVPAMLQNRWQSLQPTDSHRSFTQASMDRERHQGGSFAGRLLETLRCTTAWVSYTGVV